TAAAFRGEWFVGGDLVSRDAEGYVTYCGRADDVLKVGGKWLAPQEVESCLMRHPAVAECAVVGVENAAGLTKPFAFVVAKEELADLEEELKRHALEELEPYKHPRRVIRVEEMPRTHLGKIDRGKLKEMAPEGG
ncbi:MAG: benzoate-CoA ligase family protein, partial [Thermoanaerobaculia bacterium]